MYDKKFLGLKTSFDGEQFVVVAAQAGKGFAAKLEGDVAGNDFFDAGMLEADLGELFSA
ncbi:MAG: hypothetical protein M1347_02420 [Chloroflexi bacterium]|nr:hypothetical protein [Chloroflexota bacterium]